MSAWAFSYFVLKILANLRLMFLIKKVSYKKSVGKVESADTEILRASGIISTKKKTPYLHETETQRD